MNMREWTIFPPLQLRDEVYEANPLRVNDSPSRLKLTPSDWFVRNERVTTKVPIVTLDCVIVLSPWIVLCG
jgi:hypothetical protein